MVLENSFQLSDGTGKLIPINDGAGKPIKLLNHDLNLRWSQYVQWFPMVLLHNDRMESHHYPFMMSPANHCELGDNHQQRMKAGSLQQN